MKEIQVISYSSTHFALLAISELVAISRNLKIMKTTATQDSQAQAIPCKITPIKTQQIQHNRNDLNESQRSNSIITSHSRSCKLLHQPTWWQPSNKAKKFGTSSNKSAGREKGRRSCRE